MELDEVQLLQDALELSKRLQSTFSTIYNLHANDPDVTIGILLSSLLKISEAAQDGIAAVYTYNTTKRKGNTND